MAFSPEMSQEEKLAHYFDVANRYIAAVNAKDLDAVLSLFAEDGEVHDPVGREGRSFYGQAELREFYQYVFTRAQLEIIGPLRGSFTNMIAAPVIAKVPGQEIDVITTTEFDDEGLVRKYHAYWSTDNVRQV